MITVSRPIDRFWRFIGVPAIACGCWRWQGYRNPGGYGQFFNGKKRVLAHRWSYEHFREPIPEGLDLDHLCRDRACVNPDHLEPVTRRVNLERGIGVLPMENARRTHCINGHAFDDTNTYSWRGRRMCRSCRATNLARHKAKK